MADVSQHVRLSRPGLCTDKHDLLSRLALYTGYAHANEGLAGIL